MHTLSLKMAENRIFDKRIDFGIFKAAL